MTTNIIYQHSNRFNVNRYWTGHFWTANKNWAKHYDQNDASVFEIQDKLNAKADPSEPVFVKMVK